MLSLIKKICKDLFTGVDGETYHFAKFSWAGSIIAICAAAVHAAYTGHTIDFSSFGVGVGTITAAHAGAIYGMRSQEPGGKNGS